jgi:DNA mismatch repair protein MLH1
MSGSAPVIRKLDQITVNRIAAGEVIQRPCNAVKEMIENSLDAGATSISVTSKNGGLSFLQIQDNGHGIRREDLGIVCERFTTSKISNFEDLKSISTFGFRGEALASITHVANVTLVTKTKDSPCAYKAKFCDGSIVAHRAGEKAEAKPCAGVIGTIITVEDLFHNMTSRKNAYRGGSEEYNRILAVITQYAIHYGDKHISFTSKKHGHSSPDFHTPSKSSTLENIKIAYGKNVSDELLSIGSSHAPTTPGNAASESSNILGEMEYSLRGYISNPNYSSKKGTYIFFINNRLIECGSIKRVIDNVYAQLLPKHARPFIYISLTLPPHHVDVNVHPTKKEVCFLHEESLLEKICISVEDNLKNANESRKFYTQSLLTQNMNMTPFDDDDIPRTNSDKVCLKSQSEEHEVTSNDSRVQLLSQVGLGSGSEENSNKMEGLNSSFPQKSDMNFQDEQVAIQNSLKRAKPAYRPNKMVRTDMSTAKIDSFFSTAHKFSEMISSESTSGSSKRIGNNEEKVPIDSFEPIYCGMCITDPTNNNSEGRVPSGTTQKVVKLSLERKCECCGSAASFSQNRPTGTEANEAGRLLPPLIETSNDYDSVRDLIHEIKLARHKGTQDIFRKHSFVGVVHKDFSAIQFSTKLLLINHSHFLENLFYQLAIRKFGEMGTLQFGNSLPLAPLIQSALRTMEIERDEAWDEANVVSDIITLLVEKAQMLEEYFRIVIDNGGNLHGIPNLLEGYTPLPSMISKFIILLATETNWSDERLCFESIARQVAKLYCALPTEAGKLTDEAANTLRLKLYPAMRAYLIPSHAVGSNKIIQVASLEELYKTFERC